MCFEMTQKFTNVGLDSFSRRAELPADFLGDPGFGVAEFEKLEHARAHQVQPEHLPLAYVEDDGAVLVMGRADLFR